MQSEKFARRKPIFLTGLKGLLRLADHLKLVVAEKLFQRSFNPSQFRRNRLRLRNVLRNDKPAPDCLRRLRRGRRGHRQEKNRDYDRQRAMHEQLFRGVIGRQSLQSFGPKDCYPVLFHLEDRDRRIRTNDRIDPGI